MTLYRIALIVCDGCGEWSIDESMASADSVVTDVRRDLRGSGWVTRVNGGEDYCPDCRPGGSAT